MARFEWKRSPTDLHVKVQVRSWEGCLESLCIFLGGTELEKVNHWVGPWRRLVPSPFSSPSLLPACAEVNSLCHTLPQCCAQG